MNNCDRLRSRLRKGSIFDSPTRYTLRLLVRWNLRSRNWQALNSCLRARNWTLTMLQVLPRLLMLGAKTKPTIASRIWFLQVWLQDESKRRILLCIFNFESNSFSDSIGSDTMLVLVNAVYFKGSWENKFDPSLTEDRPFHVDGTATEDVPTMYIEQSLRFGDLPDLSARFIEIPYEVQRKRIWSMMINCSMMRSESQTLFALISRVEISAW